MSKTIIYTIYDNKSKLFNNPFFQLDAISAKRSFIMACSDPTSYIHNFPADYDLYELGTYDPEGAGFTLHSEPIFFINGVDAVAYKN